MKKILKIIPTVTLIVCAYNEEQNILSFLKSVLKQNDKSYIFDKIIVVSDGSTDSTVQLISSLNSNKVTVFADGRRLGKSTRLNYLYKSIKSDILIQSDADVIFAHTNVIEQMIQPLLASENVAMSGGNPVPLPPMTFTENAVNTSCFAYHHFRQAINNGNNVFSADGRLLAFKKILYSNSFIPEDMIANDMYMYFVCLSKGFSYRFVDKAVVLFRSPQTLSDHIRQNTRFEAGPIRMTKYFKKELVRSETHIPFGMYMYAVGKQFLSHPVAALYIAFINTFCRIKAFYSENRMTALWPMAMTTKFIK